MEIKGIDFLRLMLTLPSKSLRPGDRLAKAEETLEGVLINLTQYQMKSILYSYFLSFYPMSFFLFQESIQDTVSIVMSS